MKTGKLILDEQNCEIKPLKIILYASAIEPC